MTFVFKGGIGGCTGRGGRAGLDPFVFGCICGGRSGLGGLASVLPIIFVLYLNDLGSKTLLSKSLILSL